MDTGGGILEKPPCILSPINNTYTSNVSAPNVSFHAQLAGNANYSINYSLDDGQNMSVPLTDHYFGFVLQNESYLDSQVPLPKLYNGSHHITVCLGYYISANFSAGPNDEW